jgi:plastocyanin
MMKKLLTALALLALSAVLLAACGTSANASSGSSTSNTQSNSGNVVTVKTGPANFLQSSVTLNKGDSLQIINTASDIHIISLGSWVNGKPEPAVEPGAPQIQTEQLSASSTLTVGPFNTPGTYHLYCTIHPNMNLTVTVK